MNISTTKENQKLTVILEGRLDYNTSPQLDGVLRDSLDGITDLTIDMDSITYISSAGLRLLLSTQKTMKKQGVMRLINVRPEIMEIFEITGFSEILNIE
ncbi:MAG: STAS domain-containing protein [Lachnospiraceae bacterium]|nr:STAS domain-containing protein [Lachnospiraceae bacterium]MBR6020639.1 STAS domain-containing protein [Lachnospiraceae bacterium]